jgi:hypothetical protein
MDGLTGEFSDLSALSRTNFPDRLLNLAFGMGCYPEPTQFQLTTSARLLDKALTDWDLARAEFASHKELTDGPTSVTRSPKPGITRALFRAIGHLEDLVDSLNRALQLVSAMRSAECLGHFADLPLPDEALRDSIRLFRNRIAHGDEDIAGGKAGQGLATATLRPDKTGIELQRLRLEYVDLAAAIEMVHGYLKAVSEHVR